MRGTPIPRLLACAFLMALSALRAEAVRAQVGNRDFISPLVTYDPSPSNELTLQPYWFNTTGHGQTYAMAFQVEKQLSENFSFMVADYWNYLNCPGGTEICIGVGRNKFPRHAAHRHHNHKKKKHKKKILVGPRGAVMGTGDLELLGNFAFYTSAKHELRLGIDIDSFWPTGHLNAGSGSHPLMGPVLLIAKGMGDLPDNAVFKFLRPLAFGGDAEFLDQITGSCQYVMLVNTIIEYSIPYLIKYVNEFHLPGWIASLVPFSEFTYEQIVAGRYGGTPPDFRWIPGIAYVTERYQFSIGAEIPINHRATIYDKAAVLAEFDMALDQIWPQTGWTLF